MPQEAAPTDDRPAARHMPADGRALGGDKVLVTGSGVDMRLLEPLRRRGLEPWRPDRHLSERELARELRGVVAYLHGGEERATETALRSAEGTLRVVAFLGVGYENFVDVAAANDLGIVVTNTPGAATTSVATFAIGQIVNANWRITRHLGSLVPDWADGEELPYELGARKIGIVGLGSIGTRIAHILKHAFGANLAYFSRTRKQHLEASLDMPYKPLHELAEFSDILVVMVPGTGKTISMIDSSVISRLGQGSVLVNIARPAIVDAEALYNGMKEDRIAVAVFDGFYGGDSDFGLRIREDFPDRLLVTGHIASHTRQAMDRMVRQAVKSIENVLDHGVDEHAVGTFTDPEPYAEPYRKVAGPHRLTSDTPQKAGCGTH
ncbi:D-isomer specific 2-hydroxyacid dehydrogenase [Sphaerisporangium siamense]|uniref:Lactate dehydrogenase-like 2-hydroxyacid dehydrogenase n=1 Tax=Sphaerisporangium siamense TaxID=795645 RepID=A0A7W7DHT5_9ACTN|nr:2-hydroxyacid dehydrogenase [Sphaerisporangium siamense]MBB4706026.1 lactate dehydrogenase-like 2-hydroxyacid dehydrogenase [Sphaerisporangium siamense]GII88619.1 D-isomer specific 2-hydroxyacid dehydrogenase [Sphaerisporangium siamense]